MPTEPDTQAKPELTAIPNEFSQILGSLISLSMIRDTSPRVKSSKTFLSNNSRWFSVLKKKVKQTSVVSEKAHFVFRKVTERNDPEPHITIFGFHHV